MARTRIAVALILCLAGGALALTLLSKHYGVPLLGEAVLAACGEGGGCDIVSQSRYAVFLGLPLAAWGLFFYGSLLALLAPWLFGKSDEEPSPGLSLAFLLVVTAFVGDIALLGVQIFAIKAFCKFCIATYFVNLAIIGSLWPYRSVSRAAAFLSAAARPALIGWIVATFWVAATTVAGNAALEGRKAAATDSILGTPALIRAPQTPAAGSVDEQLTAARAEAKKWKDTLDDDRKLQIYLNQKAKDDFNSASVARLDLARSPFQGTASAPIAVVSYSDFMCPFCRDLSAALKSFLPTTGNQIKSYYKFFPLDAPCNPGVGKSVHPGSCELALGGICAQENGLFWEYHDKVFAQRWDRATREDVLKIAASVGLDAGRMTSCMNSAATKGLLAKDVEEGRNVGVGSTPTLFVNGRKLPNTGVFLLALDEERKRLNLPPITGAAAPGQK
ncbi:MAG: thioredoxin domain-containing protein [Vicinamibacteria bacterium]